MVIPAIVFIGSAGALYAKLDRVQIGQEKIEQHIEQTEQHIDTMKTQVDKMEVKVEFLYDDLKKR